MYIYQNELDKACFQHDMTYGDFKDLNRRKFADKLFDQNFLIKKTSSIKNKNIPNKELVEELHKPVIRKFDREKVQSPFTDNIWGADLADMQIISKFNKGFRFLLCATYIYSKYSWVIPLEHNKGITIINAFQKFLDESNRRPNKIWVDKGSEFYNRSMKSWLEKNDTEMHSTYNSSVIAERFIKTLKNKNNI